MERDEDTPLIAGVDPRGWYLFDHHMSDQVRFWTGSELIFQKGDDCRMRKWQNPQRLLSQEDSAELLTEIERLKKDLRAAMDALFIASEVKAMITGKLTVSAGPRSSAVPVVDRIQEARRTI